MKRASRSGLTTLRASCRNRKPEKENTSRATGTNKVACEIIIAKYTDMLDNVWIGMAAEKIITVTPEMIGLPAPRRPLV